MQPVTVPAQHPGIGDERMDFLLTGLRAAAEPTRLRLLALLSESELTVSELVGILAQSQPRVSRHLRLLVEAGLVEKAREGSWVFHRLARSGAGAKTAGDIVALLPEGDATLIRDRERLTEVKKARDARAAEYFRLNAGAWDRLRSLHVDEGEVEKALKALLPVTGREDLLDLGTGTGRVLELFGPHIRSGEGVDLSREMLAIARAALDRAGLNNCTLRQSDLNQLPFRDRSFDAVTIHQVLHYLDRPDHAISEAARVLRPGGRILIADFAPHDLEELRVEHEHRRLGFSEQEVRDWLMAQGFKPLKTCRLPGGPLTVILWLARLEGPAGNSVD